MLNPEFDPFLQRMKNGVVTAFTPVDVTGGSVVLDASHNAYVIAPTVATTVTLDATALGDAPGASFFILLDFSEGAQTVTFPAAWTWVGGTAPTMTAKGVHVIRVTYASHGQTAFLAEYVGVSKNITDLTRGIWYWDETGELDDSVYYGQEYMARADFSGGTMKINPGAVVGDLSADNGFDYDAADWGSQSNKDAFCVIGGTVGRLFMSEPGDGDTREMRATVDGGTVGTATLQDGVFRMTLDVVDGFVASVFIIDAATSCNVAVSGGTVGSIVIEDYIYGTVAISGGTVGTVTPKEGNVSITGGIVASVNNDGGCFSGGVNVSGGTTLSVYMPGCESVRVSGSALIVGLTATNDYDTGATGVPVVISGGTVDRLVMSGGNDASMAQSLTITGGTIGIARATRAHIADGTIVLVGGGTGSAVIVDLDN